jgi:hypothetical protein
MGSALRAPVFPPGSPAPSTTNGVLGAVETTLPNAEGAETVGRDNG